MVMKRGSSGSGAPPATATRRRRWPAQLRSGRAGPPSQRTASSGSATSCSHRPCEGTDNPREAMQGYLDWEFGLVAQLARDGTHGFKVLQAAS